MISSKAQNYNYVKHKPFGCAVAPVAAPEQTRAASIPSKLPYLNPGAKCLNTDEALVCLVHRNPD
jgi:hypothetical protein